ncbi:T9SS type A sorting domain-containing protein [bacterium]|nr:T9SS type A sorting domain-containing protein [bacterium]
MSHLLRALACALPLLWTGSAAAQATWDGGGDGSSWSDPANWNPDAVPDSTTDVQLDGGAAVVLDVAAETRDLTLDNAAVSGPGALTVEGLLSWGAATIEGSGAFTANGGILLAEGGDKILGRSLDAFCDVTWDHSTIYFDTAVGASFHHHAGHAFTIVEGEEASLRSGHLDAPLIGVDPELDNTDVYAFMLDGNTDVQTTVTHRMSTGIGGTYTQAAGVSYFRGGSGLDPAAVARIGDGASLRMGAGTHLLEGYVGEVPGQTSDGVYALGDQTVFRLGMPVLDVPIELAGTAFVGQALTLPRMRMKEPTTIQGTAPITVTEQVEFAQTSSPGTTTLDGVTLDAADVSWTNGDVFLTNGARLLATVFEILHTSTALLISDDGVADPEELAITGTLSVTQTASVPPRIDTDVGFPNGARLEIEDGQTLWFERSSTLGDVTLGQGAGLRLVRGTHEVPAGATLGGPGSMFVDGDATLQLVNATGLGVRTEVEGTVSLTGANEATAPVDLNGGTVQGPGSLAAPVVVDPPSPATAAKIDGAAVELKTGSRLGNGSLQLLNGAEARVPFDAVLVVDQTAFGLVIVDDGNGAQIEKVVVEGTLDVARTGSPSHRLQIPVEVTPTGLVIVQPDAKLRLEKGGDIFGTLLVRENANAAFQFATAFLRTGGVVRGDGTLTRLINGNLDLGGTVSPGETDGDIGTLKLEGPWAFDAATTYRVDVTPSGQNDVVEVTQSGTIGGTLDVHFTEPLTNPADSYDALTAASVAGTFGGVNTTGSDGTAVNVVVGSTTVQLQCTTDTSTGSISGVVYEDSNENGVVDELDRRPYGSTVDLLQGGQGAATATVDADGRYEFTGVPAGSYTLQVNPPETWFPSFLSTLPIDLGVGEVVFGADFQLDQESETFVVTTTADSGPGSLRDAVAQADASEARLVVIDVSQVDGVIGPNSGYAMWNKTVRIRRASSGLRGGSGNLVLDGSLCAGCDGLTFGASESWVQGLTITNFDGYGIVAAGEGGHVFVENELNGNGMGGLLIQSGNDVVIGGGELGFANVIAGNGGPGIEVATGTGHSLRGNAISGNAGPAIDLGGDGVTPNDPLDVDAGPNGFQNAPVLASYVFDGGVTATGTLDSRAFTTYTIDLYGSSACPGGGSGDGLQWLGTGTAVTDGTGHADFSLAGSFWAGELTATATDPDGSTSEISDCLATQVTAAPVAVAPGAFVPLAFPNPAAGPTTLSFALSAEQRVEARVYDVTGRLVRTLHDGRLPAGSHGLVWDGRERGGRSVGSGIYFYRLRVGSRVFQGKIARLR